LIPLRNFPHFSSTFSFGRRFKKHVIKFGQDSLQISPIIPARTKTILEVMDSWLGFASPSCGCVQGLGYPLFSSKRLGTG
jgi:hypothetical protein